MNPTTLTEPLAFPAPEAEPSLVRPRLLETSGCTPAPVSGLSRLPSLDGWRAVSILLVLGSHTAFSVGFPPHLAKTFHHLFDGIMGVRFFFVVSGLLITWLMLVEERRTQKVDLRRFYIRRTLRILPVYAAFLMVAALLQWNTPCDHSLQGWIGNLTFTRNFVLHDNHISDHLWSLAVEEQFYLLWPFAFVCMTPALRARVMPYWVGVTVLAAFISRFLEACPLSDSSLYADVFQERSFFNNADALAIGCLAAVWLSTNEARLRTVLTSFQTPVFLLGLGMLMEPYAVHWLSEREWMPSALKGIGWVMWSGLGRTIQSVGFVILVLQSIMQPTWGLYRCLNVRAVTAIGVLSYSIYMWQNIFFTDPATLGLPPVWWMTYPLWLVPAFLAGILSYHLLEKPFFKLRHHFRAPLPA